MTALLRRLGRPPGRPGALLLLSLLLTALGSHLVLVFIGAAGASWAGWLIARSWGGMRWPVIPLLVTLMLLGTYRFMAIIAGPEGLSMGSVPMLPVSPAAETVLAAALLSSSWLLTGLWPFHRGSVATLVAPAAAFLLVRVGLVVSPVGMEHWRALAAPIVMLGIWHAAATRWGPGLAVGGAWLALVSVDPGGVIAAGGCFLPPWRSTSWVVSVNERRCSVASREGWRCWRRGGVDCWRSRPASTAKWCTPCSRRRARSSESRPAVTR